MIERLSGEQNHRCAYCGFTMLVKGKDRLRTPGLRGWDRRAEAARRATKDHLTPKCDGGHDGWENQIAACFWCNQYRGNQPAEYAYQRIQRLLRRGTHPHQVYEATGRWDGYSRLPTIHRPKPAVSFEVALL